MKVDKIIKSITDGRTGDNEKDIQYLMEQTEKYKNHEFSKEILRECGRLLYERLPEGSKPRIDKIIDDEMLSYESTLQKVRAAQHERRYDEALSLIEELIKKTDNPEWFKDDKVSEYHCFHEFFEELLYREYAKPTKTLRNPGFPFDTIYFQYGSLLLDLKRPEDAELALITALRWNPANASIALERAEACKWQGNIDDFFKHSIESFKYAFRPKQLGRCFRNVGYYFSEKKMWKEAVSCLTLSLQFDRTSELAFSELYYVQDKSGEKAEQLIDHDFTQKMCKKYGIPFGINDTILELAYSYGNHFAKEGDNEGARYCWQILYDLTGDEKVKKMIEDLPTK